MRLINIKIQNYPLLINAELQVDDNTTLIVGRNNTAKTSCVELIDKVLKNKVLSWNVIGENIKNVQKETWKTDCI